MESILSPSILWSLLSAVGAGGLVFGVTKTRIDNIEKDVEALESVPERLAGMEAKMDLLIQRTEK